MTAETKKFDSIDTKTFEGGGTFLKEKKNFKFICLLDSHLETTMAS